MSTLLSYSMNANAVSLFYSISTYKHVIEAHSIQSLSAVFTDTI